MPRSLLFCLVLFPCMVRTGVCAHPKTGHCKTPQNATSCYWTRGRVSFSNGTPAFRLWKVGTTRILGIYSPERSKSGLDNEDPDLPSAVRQRLSQNKDRVFVSFGARGRRQDAGSLH